MEKIAILEGSGLGIILIIAKRQGPVLSSRLLGEHTESAASELFKSKCFYLFSSLRVSCKPREGL